MAQKYRTILSLLLVERWARRNARRPEL